MLFRITHMQADPITCSYDPAKGGVQTTTIREAANREQIVRELSGKGLYAQGHGLCGGVLTISDPNGGRWDCWKIAPMPANS